MNNIKSISRFPSFLQSGFITLLFLLSFSSAYAVDPVTVNGNRIMYGSSDTPLAGNSYFWSNEGWGAERFHNADLVSWLKEDWGTQVIRVAMGVEESGGYLSYPNENLERVRTVVNAAIDNDMYVLIDWHTHHAEDYEAEAIEFFKEMATEFGGYDNVIYEVYNEPLAVSWDTVIKPYAERVIAEIRAIDPDNLIIVGTPNWSQDVEDAAANPITNYDNIAYTLHFYAGTHTEFLRTKAQTALDSGIPLVVTEWGAVSASGDGGVDEAETNLWVDFMKENKLSHLNWAINDKDEGSSIVNSTASSTGNWSDGDLTEAGTFIKSIILDFNETDVSDIDTPSILVPSDAEGTAIAGTSLIVIDNVTDGDTIDGEAVQLGTNVTIEAIDEWPTGVTLSSDTGAVTTDESVVSGRFEMQYQLCDISDTSNCEEGTVRITVEEALVANQAPEAVDDALTNQAAGDTVTVSVIDNDNDTDGDLDVTSVNIVDDSGNRVTTLNVSGEGVWTVDASTGKITFVPDSGFAGATATIEYTVRDTEGLESDAATVSIEYAEAVVVVVNEDPEAENDTIIGQVAGESVTVDTLANDVDPENELDSSSVRIVDGSSAVTTLNVSGEGVWTVNTSTGQITFAPESDFVGTTTIDYTVKDNSGVESNLATVSIEYEEEEDNGLTEDDQEELDELITRSGSFGYLLIPLMFLFGLRRLMILPVKS